MIPLALKASRKSLNPRSILRQSVNSNSSATGFNFGMLF